MKMSNTRRRPSETASHFVERGRPSPTGDFPDFPLWKLASLLVVRHGRVALQDDIGSIIGATIALTLIGYVQPEPWLRLWMAAVQSGTLVIGGAWLNRHGVAR